MECKEYSNAGNQGTLYDEYLAVCYSAFVKLSEGISAPINAEFMWATTHLFAVTSYAKLTTAEQIEASCTAYAERLDGHQFDPRSRSNWSRASGLPS